MALTFDAPGCRELPPAGVASPRIASPMRPVQDPRSSPFDERTRRFRGIENPAEAWAAHGAMSMMPRVVPPVELLQQIGSQTMLAGNWTQQGQPMLVTPRVTLSKVTDAKPKDGEPDATPKRPNGREVFKDFSGCAMHETRCSDTFNQERAAELSVLDAKPIECEVVCASSSLPALPNRRLEANTPRRAAASLEDGFRTRAEKVEDPTDPDTMQLSGSLVRSVIEDVVNLKVGLIMADWHGHLKALREELAESSARLQQEIQRSSISREQLGAGLEGTVERLARLEEIVQNQAPGQHPLHEKLNRLQVLINEQTEVSAIASSASAARVSEVARPDLDARSPSPGGRSAKLEAARASRHGCAAPVSRRSQGGSVAAEAVSLARRMSTAASCAGQPRSSEQASAAVTAVGCMQPAIGATQPSSGSISGSSYRLTAGKLKRSASELPAQRMPMSPRPGCATVRGGGQATNGAADCRPAGPTGSRFGPQTPGVPDLGTISKRQAAGMLQGRRAA